jgi:predicted DNA-binding antitoxin AbrB/MazE fold protein
MSVVVEGVYDRGIVTLKNEVNIPDKTDVLVIINDRKNKENFLKSAGSWTGIDLSIFDEILDSRKDKRTRGFEF